MTTEKIIISWSIPLLLFLAIPCALKNMDIVGGQVTAARGFISYLDNNRIPYTLADTAAFTSGGSTLVRLYIKFLTFLMSFLSGLSGKYKSALFFKSTFTGLPERSLLALVFRLRGSRTALFFRNSDILALKPGTFRAFLVIWMLRSFSVFFVQGMQWKHHLVSLGFKPENIVVIPNWVPVGYTVASQPKQPDVDILRFIFTGRIVREKGVFDLLQALAASGLGDRCQCVLAGDGPDLPACKTMVAELGLKNITFSGNVPASAVRELLMSADVFVLPTYHPEGFPNSVLEAMAIGLPVIATDIGAIAESVQHGVNGMIVPVRSVSTLCQAMKYYVDNPDVIPDQSSSAINTVLKRHSRDKNCSLLLNTLINF